MLLNTAFVFYPGTKKIKDGVQGVQFRNVPIGRIGTTARFQLGTLASLTPDSWDVELVDENFTSFAYLDADLLGVTAFTSAANRAYEIADTHA